MLCEDVRLVYRSSVNSVKTTYVREIKCNLAALIHRPVRCAHLRKQSGNNLIRMQATTACCSSHGRLNWDVENHKLAVADEKAYLLWWCTSH